MRSSLVRKKSIGNLPVGSVTMEIISRGRRFRPMAVPGHLASLMPLDMAAMRGFARESFRWANSMLPVTRASSTASRASSFPGQLPPSSVSPRKTAPCSSQKRVMSAQEPSWAECTVMKTGHLSWPRVTPRATAATKRRRLHMPPQTAPSMVNWSAGRVPEGSLEYIQGSRRRPTSMAAAGSGGAGGPQRGPSSQPHASHPTPLPRAQPKHVAPPSMGPGDVDTVAASSLPDNVPPSEVRPRRAPGNLL